MLSWWCTTTLYPDVSVNWGMYSCCSRYSSRLKPLRIKYVCNIWKKKPRTMTSILKSIQTRNRKASIFSCIRECFTLSGKWIWNKIDVDPDKMKIAFNNFWVSLYNSINVVLLLQINCGWLFHIVNPFYFGMPESKNDLPYSEPVLWLSKSW